MTKLTEWLAVLVVLGGIWLALVTNTIQNEFTRDNSTLVLISPILLVILVGVCSLSLVLYRVFTFNNCENAAMELRKEIEEAKCSLLKLGYNFNVR